jgi:hypothetical protein
MTVPYAARPFRTTGEVGRDRESDNSKAGERQNQSSVAMSYIVYGLTGAARESRLQ